LAGVVGCVVFWSAYLVPGRRARGRGGLGGVVIGSLLGLRSVVYSGMKAMDRKDYMFSSPLCPVYGNRLVAVVVEGLECCSWNRPRLKFFRDQRAEHQRWFLPQSTLPALIILTNIKSSHMMLGTTMTEVVILRLLPNSREQGTRHSPNDID
jgi:hypothetical protein